MTPIWKDTYYTTSADNSPLEYTLELSNGQVVFRGRAYAAPTENTIRININKIAQDYIRQSVPNLSAATSGTNTQVASEGVRSFILRSSGGSILGMYEFFLDWSYEDKSEEGGSIRLSDPINGKAVEGMVQLYSYIIGGTMYNAFATRNVYGYTIGDYCADYAIYYLNRSGGWDSYLPLGRSKQFEHYDRKNITMAYDAMSLDWGKKTYNNQISLSWEINTGWVNDTESKNMVKNLFGSNQVFLHDLSSGVIYPVIITDTEAEVKTFVNNNRKMISHTIRLESSQVQQNIS